MRWFLYNNELVNSSGLIQMKVDLLLSTLLVLVGVGVSSKSRDCLGFTPEKLTQTPLTRDQRISPEIII